MVDEGTVVEYSETGHLMTLISLDQPKPDGNYLASAFLRPCSGE